MHKSGGREKSTEEKVSKLFQWPDWSINSATVIERRVNVREEQPLVSRDGEVSL